MICRNKKVDEQRENSASRGYKWGLKGYKKIDKNALTDVSEELSSK